MIYKILRDKYKYMYCALSALIILLMVFLSEKISEKETSWKCESRADISYCVYYNSLCYDLDKGPIIITKEKRLLGTRVQFNNKLTPSPLHLPNIMEESYSHVGPFRSFFDEAFYQEYQPRNAIIFSGWNLVAKFDAENYNLFHWATKISVAYLARLYEIIGLGHSSSSSNVPVDVMSDIINNNSNSYERAFLFRPKATSWQMGYADIALGPRVKYYFIDDIRMIAERPICFEKAIIPGASLNLGDGLLTSSIFKELALQTKGLNVNDEERNLITIFNQKSRRNILNLHEIIKVIEDEEISFRSKANTLPLKVSVVKFEESDDFKVQALQFAKSRIFITSHGSALIHSLFMQQGGVVIEVNPYQFNYPIDFRIINNFGLYYLRYEAPLQSSKLQQQNMSFDLYRDWSFLKCSSSDCYGDRRDADFHIDPLYFRNIIRQAVSMVSMSMV